MVSLYQITNLKNGKRYFGKTRLSLEGRWRKHLKDARAGHEWAMSRAIRKYGPESFSIEFLMAVLTDGEANFAETALIVAAGSNIPEFGYNNTLGGDGFSCPSADFLARMKAAQRAGIDAPGSKRSSGRFGHGRTNPRARRDVKTEDIVRLYVDMKMSPRAIARATGFKGTARRLQAAGVHIRGRAEVALGRPAYAAS